jgi:hypothetical protein
MTGPDNRFSVLLQLLKVDVAIFSLSFVQNKKAFRLMRF